MRTIWIVPLLGGVSMAASATAGEAAGMRVYQQSCVVCHGSDGEGAMPGVPDMTGTGSPLAKPDEVLVRNIMQGVQNPGSPMAMPPQGGRPDLTEEQARAVVRYMRREFGSGR